MKTIDCFDFFKDIGTRVSLHDLVEVFIPLSKDERVYGDSSVKISY